MSNKQFFNNLSATYADVRRLDAKKINLKGKNILNYIEESKTEVKDLRQGKVSTLDIWRNGVQTESDGSITVYPIGYNKINFDELTEEQKSHYKTNISRVEDYICYDESGEISCHFDTSSLISCTNTLIMFNPPNQYHDEPYFEEVGTSDGSREKFGLFELNENLTRFDSDLSNLENGSYFFYKCPNLTSFTSDLSSLVYGFNMFDYCEKLDIFNCNTLKELKAGVCMFYGCSNLKSFKADLNNLIDGQFMFEECTNLESFETNNLNSLGNGNCMFLMTSISRFDTNLSSLIDGRWMFDYCENLTSFNSDISSLSAGKDMFGGCKLDALSVANIFNFLPQRNAKPDTADLSHDKGIITIGIGIANIDEAKQAFAEECYCDNWEGLNKEFDDKNWIVEWQFNGEATTFDLRSPRPSTSVFAKLEEVIIATDEKKHKPHYKYTSQDGTKFYNIHWYHSSNTNNEGYQQFNSLEEAISAYGVIPKN